MLRVIKKIIMISFLLIPFSTISAQNSKEINEIEKQYDQWRTVSKKSDTDIKRYYELFFGKNYETSIWTDNYLKYEKEIDNFECFIGNEVHLIKNNKLGTMFKINARTPSGDWEIISDYYYWPTGELFYVFWELFTTSSEHTYRTGEAIIVSKKLYFNRKGEIIRKSEKVRGVIKNKEIKNQKYEDREVKYWLTLKEVPFNELLK
jgi:hypothetical protein